MKRLAIERLELDLRGISQETAQAAAQLLGPALARVMAGRTAAAAPAADTAPGRISLDSQPEAIALAARLARHIADKTSRSRS